MKTVGLIAGIGRLPVEFARAARGMGFAVIAIGVVPGVDPELETVVERYFPINVAELDKIISTFQEQGVTQITMIGKVTKELMFSGKVVPDARLQKILISLPDNSDDTIMLAFVREFASVGMGILDQTALIRSLMPAPGVLTQRTPTEEEQADMKFGLAMARQIGGLDIGQTVVVKARAVMAVEAIEGTDACIRRGGELGRGGVTVAKAAKPSQDNRFDVPSVGPNTINSMIATGAVALVIEAGKTLLVERETVIRLADQNGITMVAME